MKYSMSTLGTIITGWGKNDWRYLYLLSLSSIVTVVKKFTSVIPGGDVLVIWKLKSWGPSSTLSSMMVIVSHATSPFIVVVDGNVASYTPAGVTV